MPKQPEIDDVYVYGIPSANGVPARRMWWRRSFPGQTGALDRAGAVPHAAAAQLEANFVPSHIQVLQQIPKTASEKPLERFLIEALASNPESVHRVR